MTFYHGGVRGLSVGDALVPSPPQETDGCPICVARAEDRIFTVGEFRDWMGSFLPNPTAASALHAVDGIPDAFPLDPPSTQDAVYITTERPYARWYAARAQGDLYRVRPVGTLSRTTEDHWPSFTVAEATIVGVEERDVRLVRSDRRSLSREWKRRDRAAAP